MGGWPCEILASSRVYTYHKSTRAKETGVGMQIEDFILLDIIEGKYVMQRYFELICYISQVNDGVQQEQKKKD